MARADLLVKLVKAGGAGDKQYFKKIVESLISEEKSKQHFILANQLERELNNSFDSNSVSNNQTLSNLFVPHPENLDSYFINTIPRRKFDDLILDAKIKAQLFDFVSEHYRKDVLRSYNLEPRNRILIVGPPGNGKTSIAEALAGELMIPLYTIRYDGIIGSYLGETASRLKKAFDFVRTQECILFFDEFDAIGKMRGDENETGEIKRVVNSLLSEIDRLPSYVTIVAATNHPELLDRAVWRRFQIRFELKKPTQQKIILWLKKFEEFIEVKLPIPMNVLAKTLSNLSFSEIEEFGLNVRRKYILNQPTCNIKKIIQDCIIELSLTYTSK